ncbi:MAG: 3-deoxy-D-manno-octulosonic acid transferase, partial [Syntrophomonadaceae bacterium]|nr:3-deoxy-D-manno-octulosonic acid transferase [Syntrophomonadaceae bacterium]
MWFVYNCVFTLVYLLMLPYFFRRMWRRGGYRRGFLQRLGRYDAATLAQLDALPPAQRIWVHAVSVGEIRVALDFIEALRRRRPELRFILTTTTSTGHALARKYLSPRDVLLYYPADFPSVVRRTVNRLQPRMLVLVDGEFWPNLLRALHARRIPTALINGRVSARSFRGYRRIRPWVAPVLAGLDFCGMQSRDDAERLTALGANPARVHVLGSAKYDVALAARRAHDGAAVRRALQAAGLGMDRRFLVGGSTWPGEETVLLETFKRLREEDPLAQLILVPRHMERAGPVLEDIQRAGLPAARWSLVRPRPGGPAAAPSADLNGKVLLVDTTGDLPEFYALAEVIFVGKSLCQHGGQNVVEPAAFGKAVVTGPHMENFSGVMEDLLAANAVIQVRDRQALEDALLRLWGNP